MRWLTQIVGLLLYSVLAQSADWPMFRGPNGDGSTADTGAADSSGRLGPMAWRATLPGVGYSTPSVVGEHVYVTSPDADSNLLLLCLDRQSGVILWQRRLEFGDRQAPNGLNSMCTPSPAASANAVVAVSGLGNVHAFDSNGSLHWQHGLREGGTPAFRWFYSSSPFIAGDLILCQMSQRPDGEAYSHSRAGQLPRSSWLRALELKTGAVRWQAELPTVMAGEDAEGYASPVANADIVAACGGAQLHLLRLTDGRLLGTAPLNMRRGHTGAIIATPLPLGARWLARGQRGQRFSMFRWTPPQIVEADWQCDETVSEWSTPAKWLDAVALVDGNRGELLLLRPDTGAVTDRLKLGAKGRVFAPPTSAGHTLSVLTETGDLLILRQRSGKVELTDRHSLSPLSRASVVVAGREHFCRHQNYLSCFRLPSASRN